MNWKSHVPTHLWWIIQKDLLIELRTRQSLSRMLMLGIIVAFLLNYQIDLPEHQLQRVSASMCWITICFASILNLGHSLAAERESKCWDALLQYPTPSETIYFAKLITNALMLAVLQMVLLPFFAITSGAPWLDYPGRILLICLLANVGVTSLGTLFGASLVRDSRNQGVLTLILLPLLLPLMLAASEATRLVADSHAVDNYRQWIQLLATFAVVYVTLGWLLFPYLIED